VAPKNRAATEPSFGHGPIGRSSEGRAAAIASSFPSDSLARCSAPTHARPAGAASRVARAERFTVGLRTSSDLKCNPHYRTVFLDGVFAPGRAAAAASR
jgi:hypothetical protein